MDQTRSSPPVPVLARVSRGGWSVELLGLACALLTIAAAVAAGVWASHSTQRLAAQQQRSAVSTLARSLAPACAALVEQNEISKLRVLIGEVAQASELQDAAVLLPDGGVLAHSDPRRITVAELPERWPEGRAPSLSSAGAASQPEVRQVVKVAGRGDLTVVLTAAPTPPVWSNPETVTGLAIIGVIGLGLGLLLVQRTHVVVRPLRAIQDALRAASAGETDAGSLTISPRWGAEAAAWNALIAGREQLRARELDEQAERAAAPGRPADGLLDRSCDVLSHGIVVVDGATTVRYANGAAAVLLGRKRAEMVGRPLQESLSNDEVAALVNQVVRDGSRRRGSVEAEQGTGDERSIVRYTCSRVTPEPDEGPLSGGAILLIEDLTQQRIADRAREMFVTSATHELRTPLTNIRLYVETMLEDGENDPVLRGKCINVINTEARRLERMVSDMLSVAEIEAGSMKLHEDDIRLDALFEELDSDYQAAAREKEITFTLDLPPKLPVIRGDRDKIAMALHNLIGNALKYTPAGGNVTVSLEEREATILIRVKDDGIGIGPEEQERIFDKFYRAKDKRVGRITGTGLGLSLAREVARLHGGDITVESQVDHGSTFTLVLPAPAAAAPAAAGGPAPAAKAA